MMAPPSLRLRVVLRVALTLLAACPSSQGVTRLIGDTCMDYSHEIFYYHVASCSYDMFVFLSKLYQVMDHKLAFGSLACPLH